MKRETSTIKEFILITLTHADRRKEVTKEQIVYRIINTFNCRSIAIATEKHKEEGVHFHIGVLNRDASKNTATQKIRNIFNEWPGKTIDIKFHKSWNTICAYITKEDENVSAWGEAQQIKEIGNAQRGHRKIEEPKPEEILRK